MSKSALTVAALDAAAVLLLVFGLIDGPYGLVNGPLVAMMAAIVVLMINGGWVLSRKPAAPATVPGAGDLDARDLLDLDARLDALERAQLDAVDAARWRALVESGQVSAPAAPAEGTPAPAPSGGSRNGLG